MLVPSLLHYLPYHRKLPCQEVHDQSLLTAPLALDDTVWYGMSIDRMLARRGTL
jgi:hypothetical protein